MHVGVFATRLAQGQTLVEAIHAAKSFVSAALRWGLAIGSGTGPVDPSHGLYHRVEANPRVADGHGGDKQG